MSIRVLIADDKDPCQQCSEQVRRTQPHPGRLARCEVGAWFQLKPNGRQQVAERDPSSGYIDRADGPPCSFCGGWPTTGIRPG